MSRCLCCKKLREFDELSECVWCYDKGPYCRKCDNCESCKEPHPGDWSCGENSNHDLIKGEFKTKCFVCDEFVYCAKCVVKCACGRTPEHYLCSTDYGDDHTCCWRSEDGKKWCKARVCDKFCGIEDLSGEIRLYCPEHHPRISESLRQEVLRQEKLK